jgi:hypothetical protein
MLLPWLAIADVHLKDNLFELRFYVGNYALHGDIFSFAGFMTLFLVFISATYLDGSVEAVDDGSVDLGAIFFSSGSLMYLFYFILALDLATIQDPVPSSMMMLLARLCAYISLSGIWSTSTGTPCKAGHMNHHLRRDESMHPAILVQGTEGHKVIEVPEGAVVWKTSVVVIGCGPAGLNLTNELGIRNVSTIVIDARTALIPDSRFFNLNFTTCEGLKRIGVLDQVSRIFPSLLLPYS